MAASDLTGDGELDIITTNYGSDNVSVLLNNGDDSFLSQQNFATDLAPVQTVVADVNGDGRPDLVTASNHDSAIGVLLGKGDGTFEPAPAGSGVGLSDTPFLADFNGSGIDGSVVLDRSGEILYRAGSPATPAHSHLRWSSIPAARRARSRSCRSVLNTPSRPPIPTSTPRSRSINLSSRFRSTRSAPADRSAGARPFATPDLPTSLAVEDLTGNGLDDLVAANALDNSVTIALQTGTGLFAAPMTVPAGVAPSDIAFGDLTSNGLPDIIVS